MAIRKLGLAAVIAALVAWMPAAAMAQDCKPEVKADSQPSVSRTLGAFPGSLFAWKAEAKRQHGDAYDTWLKASDRRIDCKQTAGKWVCTRTAKPCAVKQGEGKLPKFDPKGPSLRLTSPRTTGGEVKLLQQYLILEGAKIEADGTFGSGTDKAVREYQKKEGIKADGVVGDETKKRLMEDAG